jgi:hypothetical protein
MANIVLPATGSKIRVVARNTDEQTQSFHAEGSPAINAGQVNISNSAATIIAANATRMGVWLKNKMARSVFVGEATVTTSNGFEIEPGESFYFPTAALIQGITAAASAGTEMVHYFECDES